MGFDLLVPGAAAAAATAAEAGFSSAIAEEVREMTSSSSALRFWSSRFEGSARMPAWTVSSWRLMLVCGWSMGERHDSPVICIPSPLLREQRVHCS